jgi:hypothetical protein
MNAHTTADTIQALADAFRVMESVDRTIMREALKTTYGEMLAERDRLDAEIDDGEAQMLAIQQHINGLAIERSEAHRAVVRASQQLAALEAGEGR